METVVNHLFSYKAASADATDTLLALQFGDTHASYALKDKNRGTLLALGYMQTATWNQSAFDQFMEAVGPLMVTAQPVEIAYAIAALSVLPVAGFEEKKLQALHQSMYPFAGPAVFKTETAAEWQLYLGYPVPVALYRGCETHFPGARARHAFKIALDTAGQSAAQGKLLVDIGIESFRVLLLKNNRLQFFQTFPYASPADVMYYLLSVCEAQLVSPAEVELVLTGLFEKDSALYRELWQYFLHVELRDAQFNTDEFPYPLHYFTTLNDLLLCA